MKNKKTTKLNKSAWIRKQAKRLTPAEVVAKAKSEGIKFSAQYVISVRSAARRNAALQAAAKPAKAPAKKATKAKPKAKRAPQKPANDVKVVAKPNRSLNGHANSIHA